MPQHTTSSAFIAPMGTPHASIALVATAASFAAVVAVMVFLPGVPDAVLLAAFVLVVGFSFGLNRLLRWCDSGEWREQCRSPRALGQ